MYGTIENALVAQKDRFLSRINDAKCAADLRAIFNQLLFVSDLWRACDYGYKIDEICARIKRTAESMVSAEVEYLSACRKNCRTRAMTQTEIKELEIIIAAITR